MTANKAVADGRLVPTAEQVETYTRRQTELIQRFLKGVLDTDGVLEGLQRLMEMSRGFINCDIQPEIPSWADPERPIVQHIQCGMVDPGRLAAVSVFGDREEFFYSEEFLIRAQKLAGSMNACALDFYARAENWKYLPADAEVIVFPNTVFRHPGGNSGVRHLCRVGLEWRRGCSLLSGRFGRVCRVAAIRRS